jgi:hypothetical protein
VTHGKGHMTHVAIRDDVEGTSVTMTG